MPQERQSAPRAVPDFLAQADSPDKRKQQMAKPQRRRSGMASSAVGFSSFLAS